MTQNIADQRAAGGAWPSSGIWSRIGAALWRRPWARATLLLTPPLAWFVLIYIAALVVLLITAFWQTNSFTNNLEHIWNLQNFVQIFTTPAYLQVIGRTLGMAAGVTAVDGLIAFPFAYYMARVATGVFHSAMESRYAAGALAWYCAQEPAASLSMYVHASLLSGVSP